VVDLAQPGAVDMLLNGPVHVISVAVQ
jgi:hypothetical protein